jgi:phosphate transport system permease protein
VTAIGGTAGKGPAAPFNVPTIRRMSLVRRIVDGGRSHEESAWRIGGRIAVLLPFAALVFAVSVLAVKAYPAIRVNGLGFITGTKWSYGSGYAATVHTDGAAHPSGSSFGALTIIVGTLQSSAIALIIAVPISIGAAFALTERMPTWLSRPLGFAIEVLAGIPSVVIGLWGLLILAPLLGRDVYPAIGRNMPDVPVLNFSHSVPGSPTATGQGLLTAGIVLGLMIVPIISSTTRDLFNQVPPLPKEGATALGMTEWEVAHKITIPWVRSGIIGASVLGLGRALGETVAVALVSGSAIQFAPNAFGAMTTIGATILTQLDGAQTDGTGFAVATLAELGLVLAVISVLVNLAAGAIIKRTSALGPSVGPN